eukprot:6765182-Pyramimonas_sp.AAC.1
MSTNILMWVCHNSSCDLRFCTVRGRIRAASSPRSTPAGSRWGSTRASLNTLLERCRARWL